jgi:hypothetical protein
LRYSTPVSSQILSESKGVFKDQRRSAKRQALLMVLETHPPKSFAQKLVTPLGDVTELTYDSLDENLRISQTIDFVRRDDAGAIAVFLGTTRDNFQGKFEKFCLLYKRYQGVHPTDDLYLSVSTFPSCHFWSCQTLHVGMRPAHQTRL